VIDGATIEIEVETWLDTTIHAKVRLNGIDTPERRGRCADEKRMAEDARQMVVAEVAGNPVILRDVQYVKYAGRVLAQVFTHNDIDMGLHLITNGLARPYNGGKRESWCNN
jgi:micrococcal nuclease